MQPLSFFVPSAEDLLRLEIEEVAGVLLGHLNNCRPGDSDAFQRGQLHHGNFFNGMERQPPYPDRKDEVLQALMEAWSWLESEVFLVRRPHDCFFYQDVP
jgi:hypothetical protein